jgi:hypothetical protein
MANYRRFTRIVKEVMARWRDTITGVTPIDIDAAKNVLRAMDKDAKVFVVDSPKQFYAAQAIMRGRVAKKNAQKVCDELGIDSSFVDGIQICGGAVELIEGHRWYRASATNLMDVMIREFMFKMTEKKRRGRWWRPARITNENRLPFELCNLDALYPIFVRSPWDVKESKAKEAWRKLRYQLSFESPRIQRANMDLAAAVSNNVDDILNDDFDPNAHPYDAVHAEIITRAMNIKDLAVTACHEIFHHVPAFMRFRRGFLLLSERPKISVNEEGALHNATGPAVEYSDGHKFWFVDGHRLVQAGEKIIMAPETLTHPEITDIENEEERRIAIDRFGWGRYMQEAGGQVIDYRENWVDNTVEVLIKPPKPKRDFGSEPLRMVLACRSTGRKYFVAVPPTKVDVHSSAENTFGRASETAPNFELIQSCEMAQSWFANGSTCAHLPYANKELNIVGAS